MTEPFPAEEASLFPKTAGEKLRAAREAQGLSLAEIAARTRVPVRQLEAIEQGNYAALPSITYSVGFAKAYARAVDLDEVAIARDVRGASDQPNAVRRTDYQAYEIDEPSRVPPRGLAIGALIAAVILLIGAGLFYGTTLFRGESEPAPALVQNSVPDAPVVAAPTASAAAPSGAVVLTATDDVWLRVYAKGTDGTSKTLYIGTLKPGESYAVPADATAPLINVGRPDKLTVTVGGTAVAALGSGKVAIKDVPIDAAALTARAAAPAPGATATAGAGTTAHPTVREAPHARTNASSGAPLNIAAPVSVAPEPAASAAGSTPTP